MKKKKKKKNRIFVSRKVGFTLIEMLIVTSMLSVVSLAIYATFNSGIKIWQKINRRIPEEDLNIFFDKFASNLKNSFKFTGIDFSGKEDELKIPAFLNSPILHSRTIGGIIYDYDSNAKILTEERRDFAQIYSDERGFVHEAVKNVKSLKFQYYFYDTEKKEYLWQDEWENEELPLAVRIELEIEDGAKNNKFIKTVSIPAGG